MDGLRHEICSDYGRTVEITVVRRFASTQMTLGYGYDVVCDNGAWFVYCHKDGEPWMKHCGPYSTSEQAADWILGIREVAA